MLWISGDKFAWISREWRHGIHGSRHYSHNNKRPRSVRTNKKEPNSAYNHRHLMTSPGNTSTSRRDNQIRALGINLQTTCTHCQNTGCPHKLVVNHSTIVYRTLMSASQLDNWQNCCPGPHKLWTFNFEVGKPGWCLKHEDVLTNRNQHWDWRTHRQLHTLKLLEYNFSHKP